MGRNSPPPPPPQPPRSNLPMLYYGLVVVATAAIVLAIYNLIIVRWCANQYRRSRREGIILRTVQNGANSADAAAAPSSGPGNYHVSFVTSFRYRKGADLGKEHLDFDEHECAVCLSGYEDGEELRELPRCKHSFHAQCIDMWLFSHLDCPLCRAPVVAPPCQRSETVQLEHSREGLLDPGISV